MSVVVVRYRTRPDRADENQALVEQVFAELAATQPDGLRYATFRLADGEQLRARRRGRPPPTARTRSRAIAAFAEFQREIPDRMVEGPVVADATVVGSYGFGLATEVPA